MKRTSAIQILLVAAILGASIAGCDEEADRAPTRAECERAVEHAIAMRVAATQLLTSPEIARHHREHLNSAVGDALTEQCMSNYDLVRVACVTRASSATEADGCHGEEK